MDWTTLSRSRAARARELAARYPASAEALHFLAEIADFQASIAPATPLADLPALIELVRARGPARLAEAAASLGPNTLGSLDPADPQSFFARVLFQPALYSNPGCEHAPQAGLLKPLGHGQALWLSCARCLHEWEYPRNRCVACGQTDAKKLAYFRAEQLPHIQTMTCDECRQYIHLIDLEQEPRAVADIDEVAALPLDLWAIERGFAKIQPNLAGI